MHSLWTVYVAATFAAAGFGVTKDDLSPWVAGPVTFGFLVFAGGHWSLLQQTLRVLGALRRDIAADVGVPLETLGKPERVDGPLGATVAAILKAEYRERASLAHHVLIDLCVVIAIWAPIIAH